MMATYGALVLEPLATLLLPFRRVRPYCAIALLGLHFGIEAVSNVGMWQYMMCGLLISYFPDSWLAQVESWTKRGWQCVRP
ncbi:MAG: hypothetical protein MK135_06440 [Polyangiaceae bacterium]|nr:hypothetical protein [Polyangiaceae bacterium]